MNRDRARELLPIIQAFADGKTIRWKYPHPKSPSSESWTNVAGETDANISFFDDDDTVWEIKPEPVTYYINIYKSGNQITASVPFLDPGRAERETDSEYLMTIKFEIPGDQ